MHFGAYDYVTWARGKTAQEVYKGELELVRTADQLGFEHYFLPEHHFLDFCLLPNQEVFMSAAAMITKNIQLLKVDVSKLGSRTDENDLSRLVVVHPTKT
ncbi:MAG: LLM class flavin-dependent oxidoreductase [Thaumarchaeota archaeon]|nr:LLM class flavin-dependent oxidoreductase [Nitrososphaerota archaeon]